MTERDSVEALTRHMRDAKTNQGRMTAKLDRMESALQGLFALVARIERRLNGEEPS